MALTKQDLVDSLHLKIGYSKKESVDMIELIFDAIKTALMEGEKIKVSGFGTFEVHNKRSRKGRNPMTGESLEISARKTLSFKPSQTLRQEVNEALASKPITEDLIRRRGKSAGSEDE